MNSMSLRLLALALASAATLLGCGNAATTDTGPVDEGTDAATADAGPGNVYYVAADGSDANPGTEALPWATIRHAGAEVVAGDTVNIRGGIYFVAENQAIFASGTPARRIVFQAYSGETPIIDGSKLLSVEGNDVLSVVRASYVDVVGLTIRRGNSAGLVSWDSQHVRFLNNVVHDNFRTGIYVGGPRNVLYEGLEVSGNTVYNNVHTNDAHIATEGWDTGINMAGVLNARVTNNLVYENQGEGILTGGSRGVIIRNNIVHDNYSVEIYMDRAEDAIIDGNFIYNTGNATYLRDDGVLRGANAPNSPTTPRDPETSRPDAPARSCRTTPEGATCAPWEMFNPRRLPCRSPSSALASGTRAEKSRDVLTCSHSRSWGCGGAPGSMDAQRRPCRISPSRYRRSYANTPRLSPPLSGVANLAGATEACAPPAGSSSVTDVKQLAPPGDIASVNRSRVRSVIRVPPMQVSAPEHDAAQCRHRTGDGGAQELLGDATAGAGHK